MLTAYSPSINALTGTRATLMVTDGLDQPLTMSSREIAELTGKEHKNVLRDIRNMLDSLNIDQLSFERVYRDAKGEGRTEFHLPKDLVLTLISGYSVPLRHKIVTRWQALEQAERGPVVPQSLPEALRLAADLAEKNAVLEAETQRLTPLAKVSPNEGADVECPSDRYTDEAGTCGETDRHLRKRPEDAFRFEAIYTSYRGKRLIASHMVGTSASP
jgi:Rha family phage regulatory protein